MDLGVQQLLRDASRLFTAPLFQMGETAVSLSAICQLIVALLIVFVLTGIFKNFLKRRLLFRLGIDEGNREAIATIISYAVGTLCFVVVLLTGRRKSLKSRHNRTHSPQTPLIIEALVKV